MCALNNTCVSGLTSLVRMSSLCRCAFSTLSEKLNSQTQTCWNVEMVFITTCRINIKITLMKLYERPEIKILKRKRTNWCFFRVLAEFGIRFKNHWYGWPFPHHYYTIPYIPCCDTVYTVLRRGEFSCALCLVPLQNGPSTRPLRPSPFGRGNINMSSHPLMKIYREIARSRQKHMSEIVTGPYCF